MTARETQRQKTMTAKFVPLEKQSKKKRRAHYAAQRGDWGGISPVTRVRPSGKLYDRKKLQHERGNRD